MKKSLIAMAILASSGAAMAQSNVTMYGVVDLGLNSSNSSAQGRVTGIDSGLQSSSRIGLKGTEDLGNGLKATFVLENGFSADNGSEEFVHSAFGRQAWLGLGGSFGEVRLGRQYTPVRQALEAVDPFSLGLAGNILNTWGVGYATENGIEQRMNNSVSYSLPAMVEGLNATAAYSFGEETGSTSTGSMWSLGASYQLGAANLQAAYENLNLDNVVNDGKYTNYILGGTYDFGVAKAHASYGESKYKVTGVGSEKVRNYMVGVSAPIGGSSSVMASYVLTKNQTFDNADMKQFALGYQYDLSKRTNVYASVAYAKNKDNSVAVQALDERKSSNTYNIGVRHKF